MPTQPSARPESSPTRPMVTRMLSRLAWPLAGFLLCSLLSSIPTLAQTPYEEPEGAGAPPGPFAVEGFQTDLFTGAATAAIPILVAPGTAGAAPKIVLRYNSGTVDSLGSRDQGQWTGLGWTLDIGGFILRDTKNTTTAADDTFKLVFGGTAYDLVRVDDSQNIYHTKDETFWRLRYYPSTDYDGYWILTTKDGTQHRFGFNPAPDTSKVWGVGPDLSTRIVYKYSLDEVRTPNGTAVQYAYAMQPGQVPSTGQQYDQAAYPTTIRYTYHNENLVGPPREVRFFRMARTDWTNTSGTTGASYFEAEGLDRIEVWVGANLVRKYVFGYDYSVDRDSTYTWGGGATGDLTLKRITQYGTNGTDSLPPLDFTYHSSGRLHTVSNGIGGMVTYEYDRIYTIPLFSAFYFFTYDSQGRVICFDRGLKSDLGATLCKERAIPVGNALQTELPGTTPLYAVYKTPPTYSLPCYDLGASTDDPLHPTDHSCFQYAYTQKGYAFRPDQPQPPGTIPLYSTFVDDYYCSDYAVSNDLGEESCSFRRKLLGYLYKARVNRYRVISRTVSAGQGPGVTTTFTYDGFLLSSDGREFRGHSHVRAVDPLGHYTDTWFHQDDALKGRASQIETHRNDGALFTKVLNTWVAATIPSYPGTTFARLDRTDVYTYDGDTSFKQTARTFQYDDYGNLIQAQHLGEAGVGGDEQTEILEYAPNTSAYIVGLPSHTSTLDAAGATVAQTWLYYDNATSHTMPPTLGRMTKRCQWLSGGTNPCVQRTYDAYGNLLTTTDARGSTTTTTYETTYQSFPATVTTPPTPNAPAGLVTTSVYDARFGVATSTTDPNNQITTNGYDVFGRLTSITNALQQTKTISYDNFGTVGSQRITTRLPDGSGDGLWSEAYFDGLGRIYKVRREAAGGVVVVETTYDARGLVASRTLPRFEGASALSVTRAYDALHRLTRTDFPDGTWETTSYNDWVTTVTDRNGHARSQDRDAYGRIVQVTEPGGALTQSAYDASGRLTSVTDAAGNVTSIGYDTLGRKIQMAEPNLGTWTYGYDATGNLTSQTDAKGQTLVFAYDALNRLATKTSPGAALVALRRASRSWVEGYGALYRGGICVADGAGTCVGGDARLEPGLGPLLGYLKTSADTGTVPAYRAVCYSDAGGTCTGWSLSLDVSGSPVGYLATSPPDAQSQANPFTQSGGLLYQGLGGTPSAYLWTTAPGAPHTDHLYLTEGTIPGDYTAEGITGYLRQAEASGTVPLVRYLNAGTGSHYYSTTGDPPAGYTTDATLGYLESNAGPDLVPLARHYNASTGDYLLDTATTPPSGYTYQATLGYFHPTDAGTGGTMTFTYDAGANGKSRRATMTDLAGSESYAYDALGRPSSVTRITDGVAYTTQSTYTSLGALATLTYPDGETVTYGYDAGGQVSSVTGAVPYVSNLTYTAASQIAQLTSGNGVVRTHTYSPTTLRLSRLVATQGGTLLQDLSYSDYDPVGNLRALVDNRDPNNTQGFTYDDRDRLLTATGPYGSHSYAYSSIGNLLSKAGMTYTYGATGQTCNRLMPHAVTSTSDGKTYTYDCNGNLLADGERTVTWDADNKPVSITRAGVGATTFAYSGEGARVKKEGAGKAIRYVGDYEDHVTDGVQVRHIFLGPLRVATRVTGGINAGTYYTHGDHLGSLNVLTNSSGTEVQRLTYLPFGETHTNAGSVDFYQYRFTDQEQDPETGLYFYQARYYNPVLGRFISPDPLVPEPGNPQSLNRYSYVANNPVTLVDPSGHQFELFTDVWDTLSSVFTGITDIVSGWFGAPVVTTSMPSGAPGATLNGGIGGAVDTFGNLFPGAASAASSPALSGGAPQPGASADVQSPVILAQRADIAQSVVRAVFGETSGLYPQLTQQPPFPGAGVYDPRNWDPESLQDLQQARADITRAFENRQAAGRIGGIHLAGPPSPQDLVAYRAWELSGQAALMPSSLSADVQHFFMRAETGPQSPPWAGSIEPYRTYGPFINVGGGPVPRSTQVYIDFYRGIP